MSLPPQAFLNQDYALSPERPDDGPAIETLLDRAFGAGRHGKRSYSYRQGCPSLPELRLTARDRDGALVGTIRYWPIVVRKGRRRTPALLLGPLAVEPALKGKGIGRALVRDSLGKAEADGHRLVLLVGDGAYYRQFGFEPAAPHGFVMPLESAGRLQVRALGEGVLTGGTLEPVIAGMMPAVRRPARLRNRSVAPQAEAGLGSP